MVAADHKQTLALSRVRVLHQRSEDMSHFEIWANVPCQSTVPIFLMTRPSEPHLGQATPVEDIPPTPKHDQGLLVGPWSANDAECLNMSALRTPPDHERIA